MPLFRPTRRPRVPLNHRWCPKCNGGGGEYVLPRGKTDPASEVWSDCPECGGRGVIRYRAPDPLEELKPRRPAATRTARANPTWSADLLERSYRALVRRAVAPVRLP